MGELLHSGAIKDMSKVSDQLWEFHAAIGDEPGRAKEGTVEKSLRMNLFIEEGRELIKELERYPVDTKKILHELADVVVVCYGTAHAFDLDLDAALDEVHRANMEKVKPPDGSEPIRREDGKILKPDGFRPAVLEHYRPYPAADEYVWRDSP